MSRIRRYVSRVLALFRKTQMEQDMAEEMQLHIDHLAAQYLADGLTPREAHWAAERRFGKMDQFKEAARDSTGWRTWDDWTRHLCLAIRRLRQSPGFTMLSVAMLTLGIGLSTATFSLVSSFLLRSMPLPDGDRLVRIFRTTSASQRELQSPANYLSIKAAAASFATVAAFCMDDKNLSWTGRTPSVEYGADVSSNFLSTIGLAPQIGRDFRPEENDPGHIGVIMLTDSFWRSAFAASPSVLGRTVRLGVEEVTVVGVLPPSFNHLPVWGGLSYIQPLPVWPNVRKPKWYNLIARLKPGVSMGAARAKLSTVAANLDQDYPDANGTDGVSVVDLASSETPAAYARLSWLTLGLSVLVLAIACANLAGVQLARAVGQAHQYAVRCALGARRADLMLPLVLESLLVTAVATSCGILLAFWIDRLLSGTIWDDPIPLDRRVLAFAIAMSVVSSIGFGLAPAWLSTLIRTGDALKEGTRGGTSSAGRKRVKSSLVVAQLALATVLVSASLSFGFAVKLALHHDFGWQPAGLFSGFVDTDMPPYHDNLTQKTAFIRALREKLASIPGVTDVAFATEYPIAGWWGHGESNLIVDGSPQDAPGRAPLVLTAGVDPSYFATIGLPFLQGATFPRDVKAGEPSLVVVNETLAHLYWPGQSALGKRLRLSGGQRWSEVVGVVADFRMPADFHNPPSRLQVYCPLDQSPNYHNSFVLKSRLPPSVLTASVQKAISSLNPDVRLFDPAGVEDRLRQRLGGYDLTIVALGAFAIVGLLMAIVGLYAVVSQFTQQRTREIGIRMALGASRSRVLRLILSEGARLIALGAAAGILGGLGVNVFYRAQMPQLVLPGSYLQLAIIGVLAGAGLAACLIPARRAASVDPAIVLRTE